MFNLKELKISFQVAFKGIRIAIKQEQTFTIQILIGALILILMYWLPLNNIERAIIILTMILVWSLELINTQIERALDILHPDFHHKVGQIKDMAAGAVLIVSIGSIFIGILILLPAILEALKF